MRGRGLEMVLALVLAVLAQGSQAMENRGGSRSSLGFDGQSAYEGQGQADQSATFLKALEKATRSDAFQKKLGAIVPTFCEGSDQLTTCQSAVRKALQCQAFGDEAKKLMSSRTAVGTAQGLNKWIEGCTKLERTVPDLTTIEHWVEKPAQLFGGLVQSAEAKGAPGLMGGVDALMGGLGGDGDGPTAMSSTASLRPVQSKGFLASAAMGSET